MFVVGVIVMFGFFVLFIRDGFNVRTSTVFVMFMVMVLVRRVFENMNLLIFMMYGVMMVK